MESGGGGPASKKRRLKASASAATHHHAEDELLPAELWANVLGYLFLDEVLTCTAVSKLFLHDATRQMKHLCVRSGDSMDLGPNVVERFVNVRDVFIYLIKPHKEGDPQDEEYEAFGYYFDDAALQTVVPFLSRLPKLNMCFIGRGPACDGWYASGWDYHCYRSKRGLRGVYVFNGYGGDEEQCYDADSIEALDWLINSVCDAYRTGNLHDDVEFFGLINNQYEYEGNYCVFRSKTGDSDDNAANDSSVNSYSDGEDGNKDVACQTCDAICASFPVSQVLRFDDRQVPCKGAKKRIDIIRSRDEENFGQHLTKALFDQVDWMASKKVACPLDSLASYHMNVEKDGNSSPVVKAIYYDRDEYAMMRFLISNGANPNDSSIRDRLLKEDPAFASETFLGGKRVITLEDYTKLRNLGFSIGEKECFIIKEEDK